MRIYGFFQVRYACKVTKRRACVSFGKCAEVQRKLNMTIKTAENTTHTLQNKLSSGPQLIQGFHTTRAAEQSAPPAIFVSLRVESAPLTTRG